VERRTAVHDIHVRLSKKTHERLVAHLLRHSKAKTKSELARLFIEEGLGLGGANADVRPSLELILRRLDAIEAQIAAISGAVSKRPDVVAAAGKNTRGSERDKGTDAAPPASRPQPQPARGAIKDPKKMTVAEHAAWKDELMRELTGHE
jgi:hypothetical protein